MCIRDSAVAACELLVPVDYDCMVKICDEISVKYEDAGHLLGSASIKMFLTEGEEKRTIIFSGDVGNINKPIIKDPTPMDGADYVPVSYTHLDVYKRQILSNVNKFVCKFNFVKSLVNYAYSCYDLHTIKL